MKQQQVLNKNGIRLVGVISFLLGFGQAVLIYVISSYFKLASGTENVGVFYLLAYLLQLAILFYLHRLISILGQSQAFMLAVFLKIPLLTFLTLIFPSIFGIVALMLYIVMSSLGWVILDMILESCSSDRFSGRIRGFHLTVLNAGFLCGPFLSTHILEKYDFQGVFFFLAFLYSLIFTSALIGLRNFRKPVENHIGPFKLLKKVSSRKNILRIYCVSFALEFFYALMIIYTPIYLINLGLGWNEIGIIFTIMLVPFVILQYPAGVLADKRMGEKELIIFSLFLTGISVLTVFFTSSASVLLWSALLCVTRVGAALLEILRDSYFYKRIDSRDIDLIDFFRTTRPVAYIIGALLSTLFIFFFPLKSVFLLVSLVLFAAIIPASRLVDNLSEKEIFAQN